MNVNDDLIRSRLRRYKRRFADAILILRIRRFYYAVYEDAALVAVLSGRPVRYSRGAARVPYCELSEDLLAETISILRKAGCDVAVIDRATGAARLCHTAACHLSGRDTIGSVSRVEQPPRIGGIGQLLDDTRSQTPTTIGNDCTRRQSSPVPPVVNAAPNRVGSRCPEIVPPKPSEKGSAETTGKTWMSWTTALVTLVMLLSVGIGAVGWLLPTRAAPPPISQRPVVKTVSVTYRELVREIHLNGVLSYSTGQVMHIAAPLPGRVEGIATHSTGECVASGEPLFSIYSDELFAAHQKLLKALNTEDPAKRLDPSLALFSENALLAGRKELLLLGILPEELHDLEQARHPSGLLPIRTRARSVLLDMSVAEGSEVKRGDRLCRLVEPDPIWLSLDIPAEDLAWVLPGRRAEVIVRGKARKEVASVVTVVSPVVNGDTQTAKIGIPLPNPHQDLKPGIPAEAILRVSICSDGTPESTPLEGKYFCLRHPEFVQDAPGRCPKSGKSLSGVPVSHHKRPGALTSKVIAIPTTAVLDLEGSKLAYRLSGHGSNERVEIVKIRVGLSAQGRDDHGNLKDYVPVISGLRIGDRILAPINRRVRDGGLRGGTRSAPAATGSRSRPQFWTMKPRLPGMREARADSLAVLWAVGDKSGGPRSVY